MATQQNRPVKCKLCEKKFVSKSALIDHIERVHVASIPKGWSPARYENYLRTGKTEGRCVECHKLTTWNETTGKYNRMCGSEACKKKARERASKNYIGLHGKPYSINNPEQQAKMIYGRKNSGTYVFEDEITGKKYDAKYDSSYGKDFLEMIDTFLNWDGQDVSAPSPHIYWYTYEGEKHFYMPDVYLHSINCEVELKDGGDNPNMHPKIQAVDKVKEAAKDKVMDSLKGQVNYIKICNKDYKEFFALLSKLKEQDECPLPKWENRLEPSLESSSRIDVSRITDDNKLSERFTAYHLEEKKVKGSPWDEELYSKTLDQEVCNVLSSVSLHVQKGKVTRFVYTLGKDYKAILLGAITIYWYDYWDHADPQYDFEWDYQEDINIEDLDEQYVVQESADVVKTRLNLLKRDKLLKDPTLNYDSLLLYYRNRLFHDRLKKQERVALYSELENVRDYLKSVINGNSENDDRMKYEARKSLKEVTGFLSYMDDTNPALESTSLITEETDIFTSGEFAEYAQFADLDAASGDIKLISDVTALRAMEGTDVSHIDSKYVGKERYDLSNYRRVPISKSVLVKYKSKYSFLKHVRENDNGVIWFDGDNVVGVLGAAPHKETLDQHQMWIHSFEISKDYQKHGLSRQMLDYAIHNLGAQYLTVAKKNEVALELYKKVGFISYGENKTQWFMKLKNAPTPEFVPITEARGGYTVLVDIIALNKKTNNMEYILPNDGKIITEISEEDYYKYYKLLSPVDFEKYNGGVCWDYVLYEAKYFDKHFPDVKYKTYFFCSEKGNSHTFLIFEFDGTYYWYESSWKHQIGLYGFKTERDAIDYVSNLLLDDLVLRENRGRPMKGFTFEYDVDEIAVGTGCKAFMDYMTKKLNKIGDKKCLVKKRFIRPISEIKGTLTYESVSVDATMEGTVVNKNDIFHNVDKWKPDYGANVLLVTGLSGSGKTTTGYEMAFEHKAELFQLDWLEHPEMMQDSPETPNYGLYQYILKTHRRMFNKGKLSSDDWHGLVVGAFESTLRFAKMNHDKLFIVEGVQIPGHLHDFPGIENFPIIIKGTSVLSSMIRRMRRDSLGDAFRTGSTNILKYYMDSEKYLNMFRGQITESVGTDKSVSFGKSENDILTIIKTMNPKEQFYLGTPGGKKYNWSRSEFYQEVLYVDNVPAAFLVVSEIPSNKGVGHIIIGTRAENQYRHTGYATMLLNRFITSGKIPKHITKLEWGFDEGNKKSENLATKFGFKNPTVSEDQLHHRGYMMLQDVKDVMPEHYSSLKSEVIRSSLVREENWFNTLEATYIEASKGEGRYFPVFIFLSYTDTNMAKLIKTFTHDPYAHSSLSLDTNLDNMISFNRDGMVTEDIHKNVFKKNAANIRYSLYMYMATAAEYDAMKNFIDELLGRKSKLRYNVLGLTNFIFGRGSSREDRYFCSEFVAATISAGNNKLFDRQPYMISPYYFAKNRNFIFIKTGILKNYDQKIVDKLVAEKLEEGGFSNVVIK